MTTEVRGAPMGAMEHGRDGKQGAVSAFIPPSCTLRSAFDGTQVAALEVTADQLTAAGRPPASIATALLQMACAASADDWWQDDGPQGREQFGQQGPQIVALNLVFAEPDPSAQTPTRLMAEAKVTVSGPQLCHVQAELRCDADVLWATASAVFQPSVRL